MAKKPVGRFRHVLCVYPYRVEYGPRNRFYPPVGLELIATVLEPHAEEIDVVDLRRESGGTVGFLRPETDLVCFSVNWNVEGDFVREQIRSIPERILTVVGGRHATEDPEKWLSDCPNVDIVARGDGEDIAEEIAQHRPLDRIAGISYRVNGKVVHGPVRHVRPVPDDLSPNRRLRRYTYHVHVEGLRGPTFDIVVTSRGCPFNCRFCSFNRNPWGEKRAWTARSPESVVRELEEVDAEVILFADDNFTHDRDRVAAICDLIRERGIRKRFLAQSRAEIARRPDVLRKMEKAGFSMLFFGVESAHDKTLRSLNKGFTTKQLREYFSVLKRTRMLLHGFFMVGSIGETVEEMLEIAPFARELGLDTLNLFPLRNEPHSGLEELVAQNPAYRITPEGYICPDFCPPERNRQIRRQIRRKFFTPVKDLSILLKAYRNGLLTPGMLARLPGHVLRKAWARRRRMKRRRASTAV